MKHGSPYTGRRAMVASGLLAAGLTANALMGGGPDVKGVCAVPVNPEIAAEGVSGLAGDLGVDATQVNVANENGAHVDGSNREMTVDRSSAFAPDVAVPELVRGDVATAQNVGKAACAAVNGSFTPQQ